MPPTTATAARLMMPTKRADWLAILGGHDFPTKSPDWNALSVSRVFGGFYVRIRKGSDAFAVARHPKRCSSLSTATGRETKGSAHE